MMKTIFVAVFVGAVILVECLMAYLMIPSTAQIEAAAKAKLEAEQKAHGDGHGDAHGSSHGSGHGEGHGDGHGSASKDGHGEHGAEHNGEEEIDLGKYNITVHRASADVTLKINFHLIGTVAEKDLEDFELLLEKNQHRLRDRIIFEIRNSDVADLTDPGLGLIKRRILAKSNELLGKPVLKSVVFSEFSYSQL